MLSSSIPHKFQAHSRFSAGHQCRTGGRMMAYLTKMGRKVITSIYWGNDKLVSMDCWNHSRFATFFRHLMRWITFRWNAVKDQSVLNIEYRVILDPSSAEVCGDVIIWLQEGRKPVEFKTLRVGPGKFATVLTAPLFHWTEYPWGTMHGNLEQNEIQGLMFTENFHPLGFNKCTTALWGHSFMGKTVLEDSSIMAHCGAVDNWLPSVPGTLIFLKR